MALKSEMQSNQIYKLHYKQSSQIWIRDFNCHAYLYIPQTIQLCYLQSGMLQWVFKEWWVHTLHYKHMKHAYKGPIFGSNWWKLNGCIHYTTSIWNMHTKATIIEKLHTKSPLFGSKWWKLMCVKTWWWIIFYLFIIF